MNSKIFVLAIAIVAAFGIAGVDSLDTVTPASAVQHLGNATTAGNVTAGGNMSTGDNTTLTG